MSCIRDTDRLSDADSDSSSTRSDARARSLSLSDNALRDWIDNRLQRSDITYTATVNGIEVFRVLRPLYEESDDAAADTEQ